MTGSGQLIGGRFEIADPERDLLGRGGMGDVYQGRDLKTGELVAIKALRPEVVSSDPNALARFRREGEALRTLNHPNIVRVVDGVEQEGRHYLVMEYVPGGSLRDLLDQEERLSTERTVGIALEVADALTRAHHLRILHRDLKPANVLLAEDGTPRLSDFGIAYVAHDRPLTEAGVMVGTVDYISPEAVNGDTLDVRADIWSFGVVLYEMLVGERPFRGEHPMATLMAILTQPVPDVQRAAASRARPEVPDALADLVYRMLEQDREQRIPSVRLVGAELEAVLEAGKLGGRPQITGSRFATPTPATEMPGTLQSARHLVHNLPLQPTPFVGRETELADLDRLLSDPDVRLVTVLGAGGIGKTRLALEAARARLDRYEHGVYLVALAPLRSAEAIVPAVAAAAGLTFYPGGAPRQQLLDYLRGKRMLLVFDNFEHLLTEPPLGVELVSDILGSAPGVKVLVTSRARLQLGSEQCFPVAGMSYPALTPGPFPMHGKGAGGEGAPHYSAVQLFAAGARRARPGFELTDENLPAVVRICHLVGGMPLGILLAAAWIEMLRAEEIADEIQGSLDFLESETRDLPERQRSMRAVYNHSWDLLVPGEQEVLQALSVFRGGFTRQAAQEVTGASLRGLRTLVNRSLLHRAPTGRHEMHELLRQYTAEKLALSPDEEERIHDRHCAFYVDYVQRWRKGVLGPKEESLLAEMDAESENVRAAWDWAVEQGQVDRLDRALQGLDDFYMVRSRGEEREAALEAAGDMLAVQEATAPAQSADRLRLWASILARQAACAGGREQGESARELLRRSLELLEHPTLTGRDTRRERALTWYVKGWVEGSFVSREQAKEPFERSLALYREVGDLGGVGDALWHLGLSARSIGFLPEAERLHREQLAIWRALGSPSGIAEALTMLGCTVMEKGQFEEAERLLREAVAVSRETIWSLDFAMSIRILALVLLHCGKYAESLPLLAKSIAVYEDIGDRFNLRHANATFAHARLHLGQYARARRRGQLGLALGREMTEPWGAGFALLALGRTDLAEGAHSEAQRRLRESADVLWQSGNQGYGGWALVSLAHAAHVLGQPAQARQCLCKALRPALEQGHAITLLSALPVMALLLASEGQTERAIEVYALATCYGHVGNSRWYEDVAGKHIAAAAVALSADVVAAAQERGRARDLWATADELLADLSGELTRS